jgi:hypothetical protein
MMRATVLLLALLGAALVLFSGAALAQEESLPDLTVDKTGPSTAPPDEQVFFFFDVTNVGPGDAVLPFGTVLVRDEIRSHAGKITGLGGGDGFIDGGTGVISSEQGPIKPTTVTSDFHNAESTDAIIFPGGAYRQASVVVRTFRAAGHIINCATADPDNVVVESDESNNTDCVTTQIRP